MRDRKLERKIEALKEFIQEWIGFRDFLKEALKDKTISAEKEKEFLEIKSLIARKHQGLAQVLEAEMVLSFNEELMDIVSHAVSLESMAGTSDIQFRKIENDWHLSYINLNKLLGRLETEKDQLAKISGVKVSLSRFVEGVRRLCRGGVKLVLVLVLLGIIGLVGSYFLQENKEEGLVNYLVTTVKGIIFRGGESEGGVEERKE